MYEGYGPNGVAVLIECLTDNRNRASTDVRTALTRNGGSMADAGSVSYMFSRKGVVIVPKAALSEDDVLRRGPRRRRRRGQRPRRSLRSDQRTDRPHPRSAPPCRAPGSSTSRPSRPSSRAVSVQLDEEGARKIFKLIDAIEDSDDVQNVYANFDISDDVMALIDA